MIITFIDIVNFGKLSGVTEQFTDGLTELYKENGYGKTTTAHFIKAMLFGFDNEGKKKGIIERSYYQPWNGGQYGGRIGFRANGKDYILAKTFGSKEKDDQAKLIDAATNLESTDFSTTPGPELFGIDKDSFARSAFFGQSELTSEVTSGIQGKADIGGDPTDVSRFEEVNKVLKKNISEVKGKNYVVGKLKAQINEIDTRVKNRTLYEGKQAELLDKLKLENEKLDLNGHTMTSISNQLDRSNKNKTMLFLQNTYKSKYSEKVEREQEYQENLKFFPKDVPDDKLILTIHNHIEEREEDISKLEHIGWSEADGLALGELAKSFTTGIPDDEYFKTVRQELNHISEIKEQSLKDRLSEDELRSLNQLKVYKNISSDTIAGLNIDIEDYFNEKVKLEADEKNLSERQTSLDNLIEKTKKTGPNPLMLAGLVLILAGAGLAFVNLIVGIIVAVIGAGIFAYSFVAGKSNDKDDPLAEEAEKLSFEREKLSGRKKQNEELIRNIHMELARLQLDCDEDRLKSVLYTLAKDVETLERLQEAYDNYNRAGYEEKLEQSETKIRRLLNTYMPDRVGNRNYEEILDELREKSATYRELLVKKEDYNRLSGSAKAHKAAIEAGLSQLGFENVENPKDFLLTLRGKKKDLLETKEEFEKYKKDLEDFLSDKDEEELKAYVHNEEQDSPEELVDQLKKLTDENKFLNDRILAFKQELDATERELRELDELSIDRAQCEEQLEQANEYISLAEKTQDFLARAKTNFTVKYTAPIMDAFRKYMSMVIPGTEDNYEMDAELKLTFREGAFNREITSLSAGLQDIVYLCLRGALLDVMYPGDKPVIILDDPFVNLDDTKLPLAKKWLRAISLEYQVLYYCCHNSRKMEV